MFPGRAAAVLKAAGIQYAVSAAPVELEQAEESLAAELAAAGAGLAVLAFEFESVASVESVEFESVA